MIRIVAPFGFYGSGNIGDEATLSGCARLLVLSGVRARLWVGSRNPAHTARVEPAFRYFSVWRPDPRRWWAKLWASAHAVIGGTPIMDVLGDWPLCELTPLVRSVDRRRVPMAFIGVGIENLRLEKSRHIVAEQIAPQVACWSVRCDRDRRRLEQYGIAPEAITVTADMAWLIEPATCEFGQERLRRLGIGLERPLVGVNLVNENACFDRHPEMADALADALDQVIEQLDARVIFLANEVRGGATFDKAAALKVMARMSRPEHAVLAPAEYLAPREMMSIIDCCALTVSMRYHFCLFSALQGVPFVAIERSDKISDLCWDLDWNASVVPPGFEAAELLEHALQNNRERRALSDRLGRSVRAMRDRALLNSALFAQMAK